MIGNRILEMENRPSQTLVNQFKDVVTPHIGDNMARLYGTKELTPLNHSKRVVGVAYTVKTRPGDNLLVHKAIASASAGDVIVVDGSGDTSQALAGELMKMQAELRGIVGFVFDAAVRDVEAFADPSSEFGCFARGISHRGPYKDGPGEIGVPVSIGGMVVHHGDIIIGDADGVIAIRPQDAEDMLAKVRVTASNEEGYIETYKSGDYDRSWIDEALRSKGYDV